MTAFVEECRKEWKRLGVPELMAEEMATDLEADLTEAQADGVSAAEVLGESDPRRFAAAWASERGLVPEQPPRKSRRRLWIWIAIALVIFLIAGVAIPVVLATVTMGTSISQVHRVRVVPPQRIPSVRVPNLVGLRACRAKRIALATGLEVQTFPRGPNVPEAPLQRGGRRSDARAGIDRPTTQFTDVHGDAAASSS